ncbi:hypothetical protein P7C70_g9386, partial [Phenoliferia sp. Uapishka_3]
MFVKPFLQSLLWETETTFSADLNALHSEGGPTPLSTFFDLKSFSYYTNVSLVEWSNVKIADIPGTKPEKLSCWGWHDERLLQRYNVHTDFWPPPGQLTVPSSISTSMTFPAIEVLASQSQDEWLTSMAIKYFGSTSNAPAFPDQQLLCFDNLFYVPSTHFVDGAVDRHYQIEEFDPQDPVWKNVGRHLRFSASLDAIANDLLYSLLGSSKKPYVAVHIRQGDFLEMGRVTANVSESYSIAVREVQEELAIRQRGGILGLGPKRRNKKLPVLFATDSDDPAFVKQLTKMGWIYIDHKEFATVQRFGGWYPGVLDSAILSRSSGFIGCGHLTSSALIFFARRLMNNSSLQDEDEIVG